MHHHVNNSIFDLLSIFVGFIVILFLIRNYLLSLWYSTICKKWPSVIGKITITPHIEDTWSSNSSHMESGSSVHLKYEYEVDGEKYDGNNISFKISVINNPVLARKMAEMYEKGEEVDIYYHPKKPYISVLNTK
jgi:hypothetical protein